jgi:Ca-activated chloride channel homolog
MKHIKLFGLLLLVAACQPSAQNNNQQSAEIPPQETVEPAIITFDENSGKASTTRNFYFIFDLSGSMDESCAGERKIEGAKKAINEFIKKVPDDVNIGLLLLGLQNEVEIEEVVPLGQKNKDKFIKVVQKAEPQGRTPLGKATFFVINKLIDQYKKQLGYGEYRMIVITDGKATDEANYNNSMKELKRYPFIALYGVGLCVNEYHLLKSNSIKYTDAHDYEQFGKALEETIAELENFDPKDFKPEDLEALKIE